MSSRKGIICRIQGKAKEYCCVLPRRITGGDIHLRFIRLKDLSFMRPFLSGASSSVKTGSAFYLWKRIFAAYQAVYLIWDNNEPSDPIGFIGLYGMVPGRSLYISIQIFTESHRMHGYGSKSVSLLLDYFKEKALAEDIWAEVPESNEGSRSFLEAMGFKVCGKDGERLLFKKCLIQCGGTSGS